MSGGSISVLLDIVVLGVASMALGWKREDISLVISLYKEYPVLWNVKLMEYKDRNTKELAYGKIQEGLKNHIEKITIEQIRKKNPHTAEPI